MIHIISNLYIDNQSAIKLTEIPSFISDQNRCKTFYQKKLYLFILENVYNKQLEKQLADIFKSPIKKINTY